MLVTSVDRGRQLEALRMAEQLTDVTILAEGIRIPAHKLLLSLHSQYFRYYVPTKIPINPFSFLPFSILTTPARV